MKLHDDKLLPLNLPDADISVMREMLMPYPHETILHLLINEIPWHEQHLKMYGKDILMPRLISWHGAGTYTFSRITLQPKPMTPLLDGLRALVEKETGHTFNSVLLNYYRDGNDSIGMHSDNENDLGPNPVIASLSFGATRRLELHHRNGEYKIAVPMYSGTLILMKGTTQKNWKHGILKVSPQTKARVNLTFRNIVTS